MSTDTDRQVTIVLRLTPSEALTLFDAMLRCRIATRLAPLRQRLRGALADAGVMPR